MLDARQLLAAAGLCCASCGGGDAPRPAAPTSEFVLVAPPPEATCPPGSTRDGAACVATEVVCPADSKRADARCVGDVTCPAGTSWDGKTCRADEPAQPDGVRTCTLFGVSTPWSEVFVDGQLVGVTPVRLQLPVGVHVASFVRPDGSRKNLTFECEADQVHKLSVELKP